MLAKLALFLIGALLAVVTMLPIGEAMYSERYAFDPLLGAVPRPGKRVICRIEGSGSALYTEHYIRRERLPGPNEHPVILALGDSVTEGWQVNDGDTYAVRLEGALRQSGVPAVVLNAGVSGRSMADYVARAETYRRLFSPDWVVVQASRRSFGKALLPEVSPHFLANAGNNHLEVSPPPPPRRRQVQRLQDSLPQGVADGCTLAYPLYRIMELRLWVSSEKPWFHAAAAERGVTESTLANPPDAAIRRTLELLQQTWNGRVTLLLITGFSPTDSADLAPEDQYVCDFAREIGLSVACLADGFGSLPADTAPRGFPNSAYNSGHLNAWGHRIAAEVLAAELKRVAATNGLF